MISQPPLARQPSRRPATFSDSRLIEVSQNVAAEDEVDCDGRGLEGWIVIRCEVEPREADAITKSVREDEPTALVMEITVGELTLITPQRPCP